MKIFGFVVGMFTVRMRLLPEVQTGGSIENSCADVLLKIIEKHQSEIPVLALLNSLVMTRRFWQHVELKLTSITLDGRPPKDNFQGHHRGDNEGSTAGPTGAPRAALELVEVPRSHPVDVMAR